jgi:hypothetical protein
MWYSRNKDEADVTCSKKLQRFAASGFDEEVMELVMSIFCTMRSNILEESVHGRN